MTRTHQHAPSGARRKYYARYFTEYTKRNFLLLLLGALFLLGVLLGTLILRSASAEIISIIFRLVNDHISMRLSQSMASNFVSSLFSSLLFLAIILLCGFSAVAQLVELMAPLFRGLGFGCSMAVLYVQYGVKAMGFIALYMLPGTLLSTVAILLCCREALRMSGCLLGCVQGGDMSEHPRQTRLYLARFFAASILCFAAAFIESTFFAIFANYVTLG